MDDRTVVVDDGAIFAAQNQRVTALVHDGGIQRPLEAGVTRVGERRVVARRDRCGAVGMSGRLKFKTAVQKYGCWTRK